jgi:hypothetical protein
MQCPTNLVMQRYAKPYNESSKGRLASSPALLDDSVHKVTTLAQLQHQVHIHWVLKCLTQAHNVAVTCQVQHDLHLFLHICKPCHDGQFGTDDDIE